MAESMLFFHPQNSIILGTDEIQDSLNLWFGIGKKKHSLY